MINKFTTTTSNMNLTNGEPLIVPDYSQACNTDSFSVMLPSGELLCVEYDSDESGAHIFILDAKSSAIIKKIR